MKSGHVIAVAIGIGVLGVAVYFLLLKPRSSMYRNGSASGVAKQHQDSSPPSKSGTVNLDALAGLKATSTASHATSYSSPLSMFKSNSVGGAPPPPPPSSGGAPPPPPADTKAATRDTIRKIIF